MGLRLNHLSASHDKQDGQHRNALVLSGAMYFDPSGELASKADDAVAGFDGHADAAYIFSGTIGGNDKSVFLGDVVVSGSLAFDGGEVINGNMTADRVQLADDSNTLKDDADLFFAPADNRLHVGDANSEYAAVYLANGDARFHAIPDEEAVGVMAMGKKLGLSGSAEVQVAAGAALNLASANDMTLAAGGALFAQLDSVEDALVVKKDADFEATLFVQGAGTRDEPTLMAADWAQMQGELDVWGPLYASGSVTAFSTLDVEGAGEFHAGLVANTMKVSDLTSGRIVLAGTAGELEDNAALTFDGTALDIAAEVVANSLELDGNAVVSGSLSVLGGLAAPLDANNQAITNVDIDSGDISGADITVGAGKSLDVSAGTLTLADDQIAAAKVTGLDGDGLADTAGVLSVNVDDSSIEIDSDTLRVKASGITSAMIADGAIVNADINASAAIASTKIAELNAFDTDDVSEGASNLYYTDARARASVSAVDAGGDGSFSYDSSTGAFTYTGPSSAEVRAHLSVTDAGGDGSLAYDSGTGVITYTGPSAAEVRAHFSGGTGVTITDGEVAIGQAVGTSDNVTFNNMVVSGNLTVNGSQNIIEADTVQIKDTLLDMGMEDDGAGGLQLPSSASSKDQGFVFNRHDGTNNEKTAFFWDESADKFRMAGDVAETDGVLSAGNLATLQANIEGDLTGDVTGQVSDISNHDTGDLAEGSNLYFTDARARAAVSHVDAGGDGSFAYDSSTGVFTYTGPSASEVRAHFTAGDGLAVSAGDFSVNVDDSSIEIDSDTLRVKAAGITDAMLAGSIASTKIAELNAFDTDDLSEGASNLYFTDERVDDRVAALVVGGDAVSATYDDAGGSLTLAAQVDDSSIEIASDALQVKALGITNDMLAGSIASSKIAELSAFDTADLAEGTNLYYTDARARAAVSAVDAGGDGSFSYDSSTGAFTYTGPSAAEVRAHFSAGTGVTITDGEVAIGQPVAVSDTVRFAKVEIDDANHYLDTDVDGLIVRSAGNIDLSAPSGHIEIDAAIIPSSDNALDLGSSAARFANIYTGDLNLRNDRGDWTLIEENDFISFRNNKTGRRFRMVMEDITGTGTYGPGNDGEM